MSAAKAIGDHLHDWICGSEGRWVSMAVTSDGNKYGVPEGLIYSFPVTCQGKISFYLSNFYKSSKMAPGLLSTVLKSASSRAKSSPSPLMNSLAKPNTLPSSSRRHLLNLSNRQNKSYRIVLQVHCSVLLKNDLCQSLCVQKVSF